MAFDLTPDMDRQVVKLRRELDAAYERIAELEGALAGLDREAPVMFGLTAQQSVLLAALSHREMATHQSLCVAMSRAGQEPSDPNLLKVQVHKLRKRLAAHGVEIVTVWGVGYRMPADSRAKVKAARNSGSRQEAADCLARSANCLLPTAGAAS